MIFTIHATNLCRKRTLCLKYTRFIMKVIRCSENVKNYFLLTVLNQLKGKLEESVAGYKFFKTNIIIYFDYDLTHLETKPLL